MSQQANLATMATLSNLTHDIFVGDVADNVRRLSPTSRLFQDMPAGDYRLEGASMKGAIDLEEATGAMATDGHLPDNVDQDVVEFEVTPVRRYKRIALDNLIEKQASGPGAYEAIGDRIFTRLWKAWEAMERRHSVGYSTGLIGKVESRTSSTVFVIKDAYGNAGTDPMANIAKGTILAWWDLTATAAIDGAGKVASYVPSTRTVTMASATTWEPADLLAADDLIYIATTNNISNDHFISERNLAPNGAGTILDPAAAATTVFGVSETTNPGWKPVRKTSTTFDHMELQEFWGFLESKRGFPVSPETDVVITFGSACAQLARSLMGFQQQAYTGDTLSGGYQALRVGGIAIEKDPAFFHNVCATWYKPSLYRIPLGKDADLWGEDGSVWSRIADFDGKEAFVVDYLNNVCNHRGANGAITGITLDTTLDADDYSFSANY